LIDELILAGTTSKRIEVFLQDASSTTGGGLTGLVYNSTNLACYYSREDDGNAGGTVISLATMTRGTWATAGFVEKDATNLPGIYQLGIPNAVLASGAKWAKIYLRDSGASGALNLAPKVISIQLDWPDMTSGVVKANLAQILGTALTETAGLIAAGFKQFFNIASPTSTMNTVTAVTTVTNLTNAPTAGDFTSAMKTSLNNATPAVTVSDKTGFSLSTAGVQAIWDALTSALTTVGSIGKWIVDKVDVVLSTRLASSGYTVPPTAVQNRQEMDSNSTKLANLDATVSSRLASAGYTAPDNSSITAIKAKTDNLPASPAATSDIPTAIQNADALLKRDWTGMTGEAARSVLNALRALRNKVSIASTTLTVTKEDDTTMAWAGTITTNSNQDPISGIDPT